MVTYRRVLVLGGARSGKSRLAQDLAERSGLSKVFIATGQGFDDEMRARIARHRDERDETWRTREEPIELPEAIAQEAASDRAVLVDCLTLWLSNLLLSDSDPEASILLLTTVLRDTKGPVILVSNEVGHGIVPATPLGRRFRDMQGRLNQQVATISDAVIAVTAGCPTLVKPTPPFDIALA